MTHAAPPWRVADGHVVVLVRLTPKSSQEAVEGVCDTAEGPAIKARVRAVAEKGRANAALERLIADWMGVPASAVAVDAGHKSRVKRVSVTGDAPALAARLGRLLAGADRDGGG